MAEYIERDAAKHAADLAFDMTETEYDMLCKELDRVPAADVVEVTRCKDCRHHSAAAGVCNLYLHFSVGVSANDYCSFGERRTV